MILQLFTLDFQRKQVVYHQFREKTILALEARLREKAPMIAHLFVPISNIQSLSFKRPFPDDQNDTSPQAMISSLLSHSHFTICNSPSHFSDCVGKVCSFIVSSYRTCQCQKHMVSILKFYWPGFMDTDRDCLVVPGAIQRVKQTALAGMYIQIPNK